MSFYSTYDLTELVRDDGIKTFSAREIATGRPLLVHLFTKPQSLEMQALLKKVASLPPAARAQVIEQGDHEGTPFVVTAALAGYPGFREWLVNQKATVEQIPPPPIASAPATEPPVVRPPVPIAGDDPFASLFKKPVGTPSNLSQPEVRPIAKQSPPAAKALTEDFKHLIETPTRKVQATAPPSPLHPASPPTGSEGTRIMSASEFATAGPAPLSAPPAGNTATEQPGEFTSMFQAQHAPEPMEPIAVRSAPPPPPSAQGPGEFTAMFQATPAPEPTEPIALRSAPPPPPPAQRPGEFTAMFQAPSTPEPMEPLAARSAPPPPPPPAQRPGEFTAMFQAQSTPEPMEPFAARSAPPPPPPPAQEAGEFTRVFQTPPSTEPPPPPSAQRPGEFTAMFQAPATPERTESIAARSAPSPPPPAQEPGEFTRVFQTPPSTEPPTQPSAQRPGEFTAMFRAPATSERTESIAARPAAPPPLAQEPGEFTRVFQTPPTSRPEPAAPPTPKFEPAALPPSTPPPPPAQRPGEFTTMFHTPAGTSNPPPPPAFPPLQAATPANTSGPEPSQPSEFTRMFNSPLQPAPLKPMQGAADPYAAKSNVPQPQSAPAGEFTQMFGRHEGSAPPPKPPAAPPPRRQDSGATNLFQTPPQGGFAPQPRGDLGFPQQDQGPPPSVGVGNFTRVMASSSIPLLADAAANPAPAKKSFFKTHLPVFLVFGLLIIVLVVILIVFAKQRH